MKKIGGFLLIFVLLLNIASASDIAYILKNPNSPNQDYLSLFDELNLSVDLIKNTRTNTINFNNYKLIFVPNQRFSNPSQIPINNHNSVVSNTFHLREWSLSSDDISLIASSAPQEVLISDNLLQVYTSCCFNNQGSIPLYYISYLNKNNDMSVFASPISNQEDVVIGFQKQGSLLTNNELSRARTCFFGITETRYWTSNAKELFKECVLFSISARDNDNDGFTEDTDCDDNNPDINPDSVEIPNNNIDENCDGHDLIVLPPEDENPVETVPILTPKQTQLEILLIKKGNNEIVQTKTITLNQNNNFFDPEQFSTALDLNQNLEQGFYDILIIGRTNSLECRLNNEESVRLTIYIEGEE